MRKWIHAAFVLALVAGCSSTPQKPAPVEERAAPPSEAAPGPSGATTGGTTGSGVGGTATGSDGRNPLRDPGSILSKRSVYFDFDSFVVKEEFKPLVEAHARYLQSHREAKVTVQGNTDERGSREYNIALGQKRADAVKQAMRLLGAGDAQIETVSFGKEKPRNSGHDEGSWAENRRDDVVYQGE